MSNYPGRVAEEVPATIEDFFTDENASSSAESDGSDILGKAPSKTLGLRSSKKKRKKKVTGPTQALPSVDLPVAEFRKRGKELIDFIADYLERSRDKAVNHSAIPGYLFRKMPKSAPKEALTMDKVMQLVESFILPGMPQWQSPKHHAFLPAGGSYASLLGSLLSDGLGCVSMTWHECPAAVELEMLVMNWIAQLIDLPRDFHFFGKGASGGGGGIIQGSTTETLLTVLAAAKRTMLASIMEHLPDTPQWEVQDRLYAYCSEQAHPSMERVAEICGVHLKRVWSDKQGIMHCNNLKSILEKDKSKGFFPFIVIATAGTIACGSVDQIDKIGPMLNEVFPKVWFHIDASYAGSAVICREYHAMLHGINYADSINVTVHKWLPIHMDCACLWVKSHRKLTFTFACEDPDGPLTIVHNDKNPMADYRSWGLPTNRRFRAMKIWMVFNLYGVKRLQQKIREDVRRAKELAQMMSEDHRFETMGDVMFGIVAFRCKRPDNNDINHEILKQINKGAVIKMTGARVSNKFWLRFVVAGHYTDSEDVRFSWEMIKRTTNKVIAEYTERTHNEDRCGMPNYNHVKNIGREEADLVTDQVEEIPDVSLRMSRSSFNSNVQ